MFFTSYFAIFPEVVFDIEVVMASASFRNDEV